MNKNNLIFLLVALPLLILSSCDKDPKAPAISNFYVGDHDAARQEFKQGESVCIEFDVASDPETRLENYRFEIISKVDNSKIFDETYIDTDIFTGLRNAHVHTHAMVYADSPVGDYTLKISVKDDDGNITVKNVELSVIENPNIPKVTGLKIYNKKDVNKKSMEFEVGDVIIVEFYAEADTEAGRKLESYHIEIHDNPTSGNVNDEVKVINNGFKEGFEGLEKATVYQEITIKSDWNGVKGKQSFHLFIKDNEDSEIEILNSININ